MTEVWLPVKGFEGFYSVSNLGRVRSERTGRSLKPAFKHGYPFVSLSAGGAKRNLSVHRIVLIAFCGPPPFDGAMAAHNDGDIKNSNLTNLRWATPKENQGDRARHGTRVFGDQVFGAKLNDHHVSTIRERLQRGERNRPIAEDYGVSISTVHLIRHNRIWRHVS